MKKIVITIICLLVVTAGIVCFYLAGRDKVASGDLLLRSGENEVTVTLKDQNLSRVTGQMKNKKGEVKNIDSEGLPLSSVPSIIGVSDYSQIVVYATVTKGELDAGADAWLITDDDSIRLVVLDDTDSKRNVKNAVRVEIR